VNIDRQRRILASLVAEYIEQGEPVSSAWLAEHSDLGLSSATVRNILARLEERGLVRQPHTSAGRVPTDSGYRVYVDALMATRRRLRPFPEVEARLRQSGTISELLAHASQELSRASHHIGFALAPSSAAQRLRHVDFVGLEGSRVLVIVVTTDGRITHRVITTAEPFSAATLQQAGNYLNVEFAGMTLTEAREAIVQRLREERALYDALARNVLSLAESGLASVEPADSLYLEGTPFLLDELAEDLDPERTLATLRALVRMIEEKDRLIELLTQAIETAGMTVVIGSEHVAPDLRPFSLVAATRTDGNRRTTVGVIGPTRMRYDRTISVVDSVSEAVSRLLDGHQ
jgi:heat-inducible transcriptional repressor